MTVRLDPVKSLNQDVAREVFSFLDKTALGRCSQVSKAWQQIAGHNISWQGVAIETFGGKVQAGCVKDLIRQFGYQSPKSNDEIIDRIQTFIDKISLGQSGQFRCILGIGSKYKEITIEISQRGFFSSEKCIYEDCFPKHDIGNGELTRHRMPFYPVQKWISRIPCPVDHYSYLFKSEDLSFSTFTASFKYPVSRAIGWVETNLESNIGNMIQEKLNDLADQEFEVLESAFKMSALILASLVLTYCSDVIANKGREDL